jgi:hypothetical protein
MPARRSPANEMNSRTSSGVLRNSSTNTPPTQLSGFSGATRNAATSVPTTMAITNEIATRRTVTPKPELNSEKWSVSTSQSSATARSPARSGYEPSSRASWSVIAGGCSSLPMWRPTHFW